ncbi:MULTISPECIES: DUF421 domain-containing protein [Aneurinibacillus]|uniref:DUF421 domain-containing protein n=1 Tax=Aneurinibacillus thermoaerophilus TaxID=143495 RepID=A0A1G8E0T7_ANETH|nr:MULTISPECIES: DUF421 domain-containing protein [Aneurinibacillus]AMA74147.1 hypothetical protein ACH33_15860 [Aneurinibacillus sp. XH2]MED0677272.1 DUF421 domain-containing protein [Aneurinibacillus thermoaerophilus]MED0677893.1 DUF421 domain-containing protein [Aneurinibacillus thermoaerophilus]MED0738551.1 DUF421 domain-containing protein [Aneurinibacillus thermoaerophilus]MED0758402.1 DUF421 domain-containing protein [Aneurinibacillus thermoaerophilus]
MPNFLEVIIRSIISIVVLLFLTRLMGKRQLSQITFFDYVVGITIGSLAAFISSDLEANWLHGFTSLFIWALIPILFGYLALKNKKFNDIVEGNATVLIKDGKIMEENLKKERYAGEELLEQLRLKNVFSVADVEFAVLEQNGEVSVLLKKDKQPLTPSDLQMKPAPVKEAQTVILDGKIMLEPLKAAGLSVRWLHTALDKIGVSLDNVYLGQVDSYGQLYVDLYNDNITVPTPQELPLVLATLKKCQADLESFALETTDQKVKQEYEMNAKALQQVIEQVTPYLQQK